MFEFNPDGSIKLPGQMQKQQQDDVNKMQNARAVKIRKDVISDRSPKKCQLILTLSNKITDDRFIYTFYKNLSNRTEAITKLAKISDKEFQLEIGTCFRRCSDCQSFCGELREYLYGNLIEEKGTCTSEGRKKNFSYEDYFD